MGVWISNCDARNYLQLPAVLGSNCLIRFIFGVVDKLHVENIDVGHVHDMRITYTTTYLNTCGAKGTNTKGLVREKQKLRNSAPYCNLS